MVKSEAKAPQPAEYTAALLPIVEPKKKRWEKKKKKNPIAISLDPDGNPIVPAAVLGGEKSTGTVRVEVGLENPGVGLPKSIEQIVSSNDTATSVPAEVGLGNPVVDGAKCVDPIVPTPQSEKHSTALVSEAAPKKKRWEKKKKKNPIGISLDPDGNPIVPTADPGGEQSKGKVPVEMGLENPVVGFPKLIEQTVPSPIVPNKEREITVPVEVGLGNPIVDPQKSVEMVVPTPQPAEHAAMPLPEAKPKKKRWEKRERKNPIAVSLDADGNPIIDSLNPVEIIVPTPQPAEHAAVPLPEEAPKKKKWEKRKRKNPIVVSLDADGNPIVDSKKSLEKIVPAPQPAEHEAALLPEAEPKKKRWEKKKKKNPTVVSLDADGNPIVDSQKSVEIIVPAPQPAKHEAALLPEAEPKKKRWEKKKKKNPIVVSLDADGNPNVDSQKSVEIIAPAPQPAEHEAALLPEAEPKKKRWEKKKKKNPIVVSLDADGNPNVDSQKSVEIIVPAPQPAEHEAALLPKAEPKKKKKKKNPIVVSLDADGNPIVDSQNSVDIKEQALQPEPEPIGPTAVPLEVELENPVVDLRKSIEQTVPSNEKAITVPVEVGLGNPVVNAANFEAIVPSKKSKRKKSKTTVPGLENPVADAPEAEQTGLIPKPESIVPITVPSTTTVPVEVGLENLVVYAPKSVEAIVCSATVPSKKRKIKKSKTTVPFEVGLENPVAHAPQSIEVEQAGLVPNPEPIVSMTVPSTTIVHVEGGLENPVDLPKCIEGEHAGVLPKPEPVVPSTMPSKKRKRKKSTDNVPVDVGLENTVVDAPKPIEVDQVGLFQNLEPIVPLTVPSTTTIPVAVRLINPVFDAPNFFNGIVWTPQCGSSRIYENNNNTSTFPIDVEARGYVEICVLCRKKGHSIPTCPELNNLHVRSGVPKLEMEMREKLPPMPWGRRKRKKSSCGKEVGPL
ncbi:hypothetical protein ACFX15_025718 [Malus domestica]|uniref:Uncharacterized protein n=1 Tax=Malus domestica TaxID=3750 RepID=A0A498KCH3_MALDO|nr:hypothetical protein DVH24_017911 [Malus domestica]